MHHAVAPGSANAPTPSWPSPGIDVLLLELAVRLEQDQRHLERQVVLEVGADLLVRALGVAGDALEVLLELGVVIDLEVVGRVDVPLELVVVDVVLAEVRHERRLRAGTLAQPATTTSGSDESERAARELATARACA